MTQKEKKNPRAKKSMASATAGPGGQRWLRLNECGRLLRDAFGHHAFLVGSATHTKDWRDLDVVMILDDDEWDAMFGRYQLPLYTNAKWALLCSAISVWMMQVVDAQVDFKIQRQTQANEDNQGVREPLGVIVL